MLQTNAGYAPLVWDRRPVDRTAVIPLAGAFAAILVVSPITGEITGWGDGHAVIRPCVAVLLIFASLSRLWLSPCYLLVALAAESCAAVFSSAPLDNLLQGVADTLEAGLFLFMFVRFQSHIVHYERLIRFLIGITLVGAICPATGAVGFAAAAALLLHAPFAATWSDRFLSDALAIICFVPQSVAILSGDLLRGPQRRALLPTLALAVSGCLLTAYLTLYTGSPFRFLLISFMLLSTVMLPLAGAFLVVLGVIVTSIILTLASHPGQTLAFDRRIIAMQLFVATAELTIMPVAIILHERDLLAAEAKTARQEADRANHSKSDFLAAISHEIRNPLGAVVGFANSLQKTQLSDEQRQQLALLQEAGQAVIAVTNDILDIARAERGLLTIKPAPFSIASLVRSVAEMMEASAHAKKLVILVKLAPTLPAWVMGDVARLRQVLFNFVGNALKFTEQGTVTIRAAPEADRGLCRFEVVDTGIGLTPGEQARLFTPFVRIENDATPSKAGTGLGLSLSKRLIESMPGGTVGVSSQQGTGSTFWFALELPACGPAPEVKQVACDVLPARPLDVLVAEDDLVNQMIIKAILQRAGHRVTLVENGQQAVDAIERQHFDVVLMDMEMPVMDGLDATRAIRAKADLDHHIPIIALTANAMAGQVAACLGAGMDGHLSKPLDNAELLRKLQDLSSRQEA